VITYYHKERNGQLRVLSAPEKGCWINIYPPSTQEEIKALSQELNIPADYFVDALDIDEQSRYEQEDGVQFIVLNVPMKNVVEQKYEPLYVTIPIGIVEVDDYILTVSAFKNAIIDDFIDRHVRDFDTTAHSHFVLLLFDRSVHYFLHYLKVMNNQRNIYEQELYHSVRNQELSKLMNIQKSLVYFVTTLRDNELMLMRIQRTDFLNIAKHEAAHDFLEDIIIDMSQAEEMAQIYTDILNTTMNAFASIISNNMNTIMKRLTSLTILLMFPTLIASFYGMNVPLWGENNPNTVYVILITAVLLTLIFWVIFKRQRLV